MRKWIIIFLVLFSISTLIGCSEEASKQVEEKNKRFVAAPDEDTPGKGY